MFDADYFGYSPRDAHIIDPQQRVFLECAVEALESAGCDPGRHPGVIGVYAGGTDTDYAAVLRSRRSALPSVTNWEIRVATGADFLVSRAAYKLGLRGPAVTVRAACATSLVAVHLAVQGLLAGDCDLALAGGASVRVPAVPSDYTAGGVISPDGACRTFDAAAQGIVGGDGVGLVVLKRLPEARADRDPIRAVIRGSAVNNDGADRAGYTAPSVEGQAAVIRAAQLVAGVDPETVSYVEAHGTATPIGDPIEMAALTRAFGAGRPGTCGIGSVKTNIGHTDAAAGVAGLIKTVLAVERGILPPSLHFADPNPEIDFAASPFYVVTQPGQWRPGHLPRRAGVSSFGLGGTNAHVVLEQPPEPLAPPHRPWHLLTLSAQTLTALHEATERLAAHLRTHPELSPPSVAWTLQVGRRQHQHRRFAIVSDLGDAARVLSGGDPERLVTSDGPARSRNVAFFFPGTIAEHGPGKERMRTDLAVLDWEYAAARRWARWGVTPDAVVGVGAGVLAAAVVAGMLPLGEAARLAAERASEQGYAALTADSPRIPAYLADDPGWAEGGLPTSLQALMPDPGWVVLELGTGPSRATRHAFSTDEHVVIPGGTDERSVLSAAGQLWLTGVGVSWEGAYEGCHPAKVPLPTYPFERQRYLVEPDDVPILPAAETAGSAVQQVVTRLFGEMLGLGPDDLDPDESFFDLGGDSLVAGRLLVQLRKLYPVQLALRSMFEAPTANALAALVRERMGGDRSETA